MTKTRPYFLAHQFQFQTARDMIAAFRLLSTAEAEQVDSFLLWNAEYGSLSWKEMALYNWINEQSKLQG